MGGIPEWRHYNYPMVIDKQWQKIRVKKLTPTKLKAILAGDSNIFVLDVRPLNFKRDVTFISSAVLLPLVQLADNYQKLPKNRPIVITDWAMKQSPTAAKFLLTKGYDVRGVLKGGIERWKKEGLPVEKRQPGVKTTLPCPPRPSRDGARQS